MSEDPLKKTYINMVKTCLEVIPVDAHKAILSDSLSKTLIRFLEKDFELISAAMGNKTVDYVRQFLAEIAVLACDKTSAHYLKRIPKIKVENE